MTWLAVVAALNVVVGLAYYVRVIAALYAPVPFEERPRRQARYALAFGLTVAVTIVLGVLPDPLLDWMRRGEQLVR